MLLPQLQSILRYDTELPVAIFLRVLEMREKHAANEHSFVFVKKMLLSFYVFKF